MAEQDVLRETVLDEDAIEHELETRREQFAQRLVTYLAWGTGLASLMAVVMWILAPRYTQLLGLAVSVGLSFAVTWVYRLLRRRNQTRTGVHAVLWGLLLVVMTSFVFLPEIQTTLAVGLIVAVFMAYQLLGKRSGSRYVLRSLVIVVAGMVLSHYVAPRWFTPLNETFALVISTAFVVLGLLVTAILIRQSMVDQEDYFRQSRRSSARVEEMVAAERTQREQLQNTTRRYVGYMAAVGKGDLSLRLSSDEMPEDHEDPLLMLGNQLNDSVTSLLSMLIRVGEAAAALSSATAEILAATTQQASGATEQSAAISQATTTVDEIRAIAEQLVGRSQSVADTSQRTLEVSQAGQEMVAETIDGMAQIKARVDVIEENILALSERTQQIGEIIDTVNAIATQSNMLALNASVEAARAGEQGKGFAVVAGEVRDLAQRSTQATAQVKAILSDIQKATASTAMATEEGKKGVDAGVRLVAQMGEAIGQLSQAIDESAQSAMQMVAGGQQQTSGMEQIAVAMQNINQVTVQSLSSARQAEKAAQELNDLARSLDGIVVQYRI